MDDPVVATLVRVPAGRVALSDRRTQFQWTVEVADFHLGEVAVTEGQYRTVVGTGPVGTVGGGRSSDADSRLPMVEVSWWDAVRFCNALSERAGLPPAYRVDVAAGRIEWGTGAAGYQLPTEAEWGSTPAGPAPAAPGTGRSTRSPGTGTTPGTAAVRSVVGGPTRGVSTHPAYAIDDVGFRVARAA